MEGNDKYICKYPEEDLVRILKDSSYHSEEWEETDSEEDSDKENETTTEAATKEKKTSIHIYERWWRSSAVCIINISIFFVLLFTILLNNCLIYLLKLRRLLHDRIDPTVELLRKKQDQTKKKRVQRYKSVTTLPPKGAPSWCLTRQALEKLNRPMNNIPVYDCDTEDIQEEHDSSHDTGNEYRNRVNSNKKKRKKSKHEKKHKKKSKKNR